MLRLLTYLCHRLSMIVLVNFEGVVINPIEWINEIKLLKSMIFLLHENLFLSKDLSKNE